MAKKKSKPSPSALDEGKVRQRVRGRDEAQELIELCEQSVEKLGSPAAVKAFWKRLRDRCLEAAPLPKPVEPEPEPDTAALSRQWAWDREDLDDAGDERLCWEAQQGLQQIRELVETIDEISDETRERDQDGFLEDVRSRAVDMAQTIRKIDRYTPKQEQAVINWQHGVSKWANKD